MSAIKNVYKAALKAWPYPKRHSNFTLTMKDTLMTALWIGVVLSAIILIVYGIKKRKNKKISLTLIIGLIILLFFVILSCLEPAAITVWPYNLSSSLYLCNEPPFIFNPEKKKEIFPHYPWFEQPQHFRAIQQELDSIGAFDTLPEITESIGGTQAYIGGEQKSWKLIPFKVLGNNIDKNIRKIPYLWNLIQQCPEIVTVMYSVIEGGKHIPIHTGYFKGIVRYHLGMHCPEPDKTWIEVHQQKYHWKEGESVIFDDVFPHQVFHTGSKPRAILWFDIQRDFHCNFFNRWTDIQMKWLQHSAIIEGLNKRSETQMDI